MAKKLLCVAIIVLALVCTLASCGHEHVFGEWMVAKDATCITEGVETRTCECGESETRPLTAKGHTDGEWITDKDATCTEDGSKHQICSVCEATIKTEAIAMLGHTNGEWITEKDPTCTEDGSKHQICSVCEATIKTEAIAMLGHTNGEWITDKDPTCTEDGNKHQICSVCEATIKTEAITKLDHIDGEWIIDKEATCTEDGSKHQICSVCETTIKSEVIKSGHINVEWITVAEATKTEDGLQELKCSICSTKFEEKILHATGSLGLAYEINSDGKTCSITGLGFCEEREIIISEYINDFMVTKISPYAFSDEKNIVSITIPETVTEIGNNAFEYCYNLTSISIPKSITKIYDYAFENCFKLVEVINKSSLELTLGASDHGYLAKYALSIEKENSKIQNIDDFLFYTQGENNYLVNYVGTSEFITLPEQFNKQSYIINDYAFSSNRSIYSIIIPDGVTEIRTCAFNACTNLTSVTLGKNVTKIHDNAFRFCSKLIQVVNNSTLEISAGSSKHGYIANYALSVSSEKNNIENLDGFIIFTLDDTVYVLAYIGNEKEVTLPIVAGAKNHIIHDSAFSYCSTITGITIPKGYTKISANSFNACHNLKYLKMPNTITKIENAFFDLPAMEAFYIEDLVHWIQLEKQSESSSPIAFAQNLYLNNELITDLVIPTGVSVIKEYSFYGCENIKSITLNKDVILIRSYSFYGCGFKELYIPDSVSTIEKSAFSGCKNLESISLPFIGGSRSGNKYFSFIFGGAYNYGTGDLIPQTLKTVTVRGDLEIPQNAFYDCKYIETVIISKDIKVIREYAFSGCKNLKSVVLENKFNWAIHDSYTGYASYSRVLSTVTEKPEEVATLIKNNTSNRWKVIEN